MTTSRSAWALAARLSTGPSSASYSATWGRRSAKCRAPEQAVSSRAKRKPCWSRRKLEDNREPWRIVYPLREVLLLVTCATIASCDDFDDIVAWGKHHLHFLRRFSEFHHGIPCERWVRALVNRIDP